MLPFSLLDDDDLDKIERYIDQIIHGPGNEMSLKALLERATSVEWKGPAELLMGKPNGLQMTVAKLDTKGVSTNQPGVTKAVKVINYRPLLCMPGDEYSHKYVEWAAFDNETPLAQLAAEMEIAALYSWCRPFLSIERSKNPRFAEYLEHPYLFAADVKALMSLSDKQISELISAHNIQIAANGVSKHFQILDRALGIHGPIQLRLDEFIKFPQGVKVTMPTSASPRDRILSGLREGAIRGAVGATNRKFAKVVVDRLGPNAPEFLKTPVGQKMIEGLIPLVVINLLAVPQVGSRIPAKVKEAIETAADMAWNDFAAHGAAEVMDTIYEIAIPLLSEYAEASGLTLTDSDGLDELDLTPLRAAQKVKEL